MAATTRCSSILLQCRRKAIRSAIRSAILSAIRSAIRSRARPPTYFGCSTRAIRSCSAMRHCCSAMWLNHRNRRDHRMQRRSPCPLHPTIAGAVTVGYT